MRVQLSRHQEETPWVQRNPLYRPGPLGTSVAPGATTATSAETFLNPTETGSPQRRGERKAEEGEGQVSSGETDCSAKGRRAPGRVGKARESMVNPRGSQELGLEETLQFSLLKVKRGKQIQLLSAKPSRL